MDAAGVDAVCGAVSDRPNHATRGDRRNSDSDELWMAQVARNLSDEVDGFLLGKRYVIHDWPGSPDQIEFLDATR